ncbi:hypothetical protein [Herbidospora mongoliensis]|uniref:hypothetical protein n=1 Tax=Herbidospora mongoliensis TaxID=688067 RepID=UPI0012FA9AB7|nr:hypothetical protein [Herbidospora mongoliensis]
MLIDLTDPTTPRLYPLPSSGTRTLELSEDGSRALTAGSKSTLLWELDEPEHSRSHRLEMADQFPTAGVPSVSTVEAMSTRTTRSSGT